MPRDLVLVTRRLTELLDESWQAGNALAHKMLELPPKEWEAWSGDHPEARSYATLSALYEYAKERLRTDGSSALPITDFLTRHVDAVVVSPDLVMLRVGLRFVVWQAHARALRCSRRLDEALRAYETAAVIARAEPAMDEEAREIEREVEGFLVIPANDSQPSITQDDIRRVEELIEKYGWHHLREKH